MIPLDPAGGYGYADDHSEQCDYELAALYQPLALDAVGDCAAEWSEKEHRYGHSRADES